MGLAKHIFLATDFSEDSHAAVDTAADLARAVGAKVTVFHAFDPDVLAPPGAIPSPEEFRERIVAEMQASIDEALEKIRATKLSGIEGVTLLTGKGPSAADSIVRNAQKVGADLIVVATHGRTGLRHLLIGSVAERVVRHAHCPVLVVRAGS